MREADGISILVDARALGASGIGRYLEGLLPYLLRSDHLARVSLTGDRAVLTRYLDDVDPTVACEIVSVPTAFYSARAHYAWGLHRIRGFPPYDVAFFPHFDAPFLGVPGPSVLTVHDLTPWKLPSLFPLRKRLVGSAILRRAVRRASRVIVVSQATRIDLSKSFPGAAEKIEVIPNGLTSAFLENPESDNPPEHGTPFVLCVGNRKRHKNLVAAVDALALLGGDYPDLRLVIVGHPYEGFSDVRSRARSHGVDGRVEELEGVSDQELATLYRRASALVFPSWYEGFGLPPLEAMACGTPVIASDRASIPEVVGDAGILVSPEKPEEIASGVRLLLEDSGTRVELIRRGRIRSRSYSWARTADMLLSLLRRTVEDNRRNG